jgi:hypothetical protein
VCLSKTISVTQKELHAACNVTDFYLFFVFKDEPKCLFKKSLERATVTGYVDIESGSESKLQEALASIGPVSIAIDASHPSFQSYAGGK